MTQIILKLDKLRRINWHWSGADSAASDIFRLFRIHFISVKLQPCTRKRKTAIFQSSHDYLYIYVCICICWIYSNLTCWIYPQSNWFCLCRKIDKPLILADLLFTHSIKHMTQCQDEFGVCPGPSPTEWTEILNFCFFLLISSSLT